VGVELFLAFIGAYFAAAVLATIAVGVWIDSDNNLEDVEGVCRMLSLHMRNILDDGTTFFLFGASIAGAVFCSTILAFMEAFSTTLIPVAILGAGMHLLAWAGRSTLSGLGQKLQKFTHNWAEKRKLHRELEERSGKHILERFDEAMEKVPHESDTLESVTAVRSSLRLMLERVLADLETSEGRDPASVVDDAMTEANALVPEGDVREILGAYPDLLKTDLGRPDEASRRLKLAVKAIIFVAKTMPAAVRSARRSGKLAELDSMRESLDKVFDTIRSTAPNGTALAALESGDVQRAISAALRTTPKAPAQMEGASSEIPREAARPTRERSSS